jgi:hypothetical protein
VAASLKKEPGVDVEVVNGDSGEFTVSVDGRTVAKKGVTLPSADEVLAAVRKAAPVKTG